jgi:hypothetical protein
VAWVFCPNRWLFFFFLDLFLDWFVSFPFVNMSSVLFFDCSGYNFCMGFYVVIQAIY